jgi:hypothetical protein
MFPAIAVSLVVGAALGVVFSKVVLNDAHAIKSHVSAELLLLRADVKVLSSQLRFVAKS